MAAEAELNLDITPALTEIGKLSDGFDAIVQDLGKNLADSIQTAIVDSLKGVNDDFDKLAEEAGKSFTSAFSDVFTTQTDEFGKQLDVVSTDFTDKLNAALGAVDYATITDNIAGAVDGAFTNPLEIPLDDAALTTTVMDALDTAVGVPLVVPVDDVTLATDIDAAITGSTPAPLAVPVDDIALSTDIDTAVSAAAPAPLEIPIDTEAISSEIDAAFANIDLSGLDTSGITAGFDGTATSATGLDTALGGVAEASGPVTEGLSLMEGAATASEVAAGGLAGSFSGLLGKVAPGLLVFGGAAAVIHHLTEEGTAAVEANRQMAQTFGALAPEVEKVKIGALTTDITHLSTQVGFNVDAMRQQVSAFGKLGPAAGFTADGVKGAAQNMESLSVQMSTLNPKLGSADTVFQGLQRALQRGGPFLARYGVNLNAAAISAEAAAERSQRLGISIDDAKKSLTPFDKEVAGSNLAMQQMAEQAKASGTSLDAQFAAGADSAAVKFRALKETLQASLVEVGTAFIGPVLSITESLTPIGTALIKFFGSIFSTVLPVITGIITGFSDLFTPIADALPTLLAPAIVLFTQLEAPIRSVFDALKPLAVALGDFVGAASKVVTPVLIQFFTGFGDAVKSAAGPLRDAAKWLSDLVPGLDGITKSIAGQSGAGTVLGDTAHGLGKVAAAGVGIVGVGAAISGVGAAVGAAGTAVDGFKSILELGGGFGPYLAAIAAVVGVFAVLYQTVPSVHDALDSLGQVVGGALADAWGVLERAAVSVWHVILDAYNAFYQAFQPTIGVITTLILPALADAFGFVGDIVGTVFDGIVLAVQNLFTGIDGAAGSVQQSGLVKFFQGISDAVFPIVLDIYDWVVGITEKLGEFAASIDPGKVATAIDAFFAPIGDAVAPLVDSILPSLEAAWARIKSAFGTASPEAIAAAASFGVIGLAAVSLTDSFGQIQDIIDGVVSAFRDHLGGALTIVGTAISAFFVLSGGLESVLLSVGGAFEGISAGLTAFAAGLPEISGIFAGIGAAGELATGAFVALGPAIAGAAVAVAPFIAVGAAIAAVVALIVVNFDTIAAFLEPVSQAFTRAFSALSGPLSTLASGIGDAFGQISKVFDDVSSRLTILGNAIANSPLASVLGIIVEWARALIEIGIAEVLNAIGAAFTILGNILGPIIQIVRGVANVMIDMFTALFQLLSLDFSGFADSIGRIFGDFGTILGGIIDLIAGLVTGIIQAVFDTFKNVGGQVLTSLGQFFGDVGPALFGALLDALKGLASLPVAIIGLLADGFGAGLSLLGDVFSGLGDLWLAGMQAALNLVLSFFDTIPQLLFDALVAAGGALLDAASWIITTIADGIVASAGLLFDFWTTVPGLIFNALVSVGGALLDAGRWLVTQIATGIAAAGSAVFDFFTSLPGKVVALLGAAGSWLLGIGRDIIVGLANGIIAAASAVWDFFTNLPGALLRLAASAGSWLLGVGKSIIDGIINGITSAAEGIWSFFTGLPGKILSTVGDIASKFIEFGKHVIQGFIDGIKSIDLGSIASDIFGGFVSDVTSFFGFGSPSKRFIKYGQDTGQGFIDGWRGTKAQMSSAGTEVAQHFTVAVTAGLSNSKNTFVAHVEDLLGRDMTDAAAKAVRDNGDKIKGVLTSAFAVDPEAMKKAIPDISSLVSAAADAAKTASDGSTLAAPDPKAFLDSLTMQRDQYAQFTTDIQTLAANGNTALANQIADLGPQSGAALAAGLVSAAPGVADGAEQMLRGVSVAAKQQQHDLVALAPAFGGAGLLAGDIFAQQYGIGVNPVGDVTASALAFVSAVVNSDPKLGVAGSTAGGKVTSGYGKALDFAGASQDQIGKALVLFEADRPKNGGAGKLGKDQNEAFGKALLLAGVTQDQIKEAGDKFTNDHTAISKADAHGGHIGQSLKDGMKKPIEDSGDLNRAINTMIDNAVAEGKRHAEGHSPSELFARELGVPFVQGIALGINRGGADVDAELKSIIDKLSSTKINMADIVTGLNNIPTEVNAVAPDGRPINIDKINVTMQADPNAPKEKVIEQGTTMAQVLAREIVSAVRAS